MNVLATQYYAPKKAFEIYLSGCKGPHCKDCHNPESWNFENGEKYSTKYFLNKIKPKLDNSFNLIQNIHILGGEPLDQPCKDLAELFWDLTNLKEVRPIWVFTKYDLNEIPQYVFNYCDYIKSGRYIKELKTDNNVQYGIKLATSNQKIYKKGIDY